MSTPTIHLTFINDADGSVFGESAVESAALPDSFRDDTVLHIGEDDWSVLEADPISREEYEAAGKLTLRLRRLESVDPRDVLYSLPTICNDLPPTDGPLLDGSELLLHSDDWRQIEFVAGQQDLVDEELDIIAQIYQDAQSQSTDGTTTGFQAIHLRRRLDKPLDGVELALEDLRAAFPRSKESRVVFETSSNCVRKSFSFFVTPHLILYGQTKGGRVSILGAAIVRHEATSPGHEALRELAAQHELFLVDWCRCRRADAADENFATFLQAGF